MTCRLRWFPPRRCRLLAGLLFLAACTEADRPAAYVGSSPDLLPPPADGADGGDPVAPCRAAQGMPGTLLTYVDKMGGIKPFCIDFEKVNQAALDQMGFASSSSQSGCTGFRMVGDTLQAGPSSDVQDADCTVNLPRLQLPSTMPPSGHVALHLIHSLRKLSNPVLNHQIQADWEGQQRHAMATVVDFTEEKTTWVFRVTAPLSKQVVLHLADSPDKVARTLPTWSISSIAILAVP